MKTKGSSNYHLQMQMGPNLKDVAVSKICYKPLHTLKKHYATSHGRLLVSIE